MNDSDDLCHCSDDLLEGTIDGDAPVLAFDPRRRTNAALIADLVTLGFLHDGQEILDLTYGKKGAFWRKWMPPKLNTNDLDQAAPTEMHFDFRNPPEELHDFFDVTVFDGPYGYRGTSRLASDAMYGVDGAYVSPDDRDQLLIAGFSGAMKCARPGGLVLVKSQTQTVSGAKRHQPYMFSQHAEIYGIQLVMELHVFSHRKQPGIGAERQQRLVHQNFSTAQLFRMPK